MMTCCIDASNTKATTQAVVAIFIPKKERVWQNYRTPTGRKSYCWQRSVLPSRTAVYETERGLTEERYHDKIELSKEFVKARNKAKKQQKKDPEHNPDPNYKHVKGAVAGVKRGKPMTFKEADSGHCNPFYKQAWNDYTQTGYIGYRTNCQTCVAAFIARRQGYDVRALPNLDNESIYRLSLDPMLAYVDKNGNHPTERAQKKGQGAKKFFGVAIE